MKRKGLLFLSIARIVIACFIIFGNISDIIGYKKDPDIYEKVFMGESFGVLSFKNAQAFLNHRLLSSVICVLYITLVLLYIDKQNKALFTIITAIDFTYILFRIISTCYIIGMF